MKEFLHYMRIEDTMVEAHNFSHGSINGTELMIAARLAVLLYVQASGTDRIKILADAQANRDFIKAQYPGLGIE